MVTSQTEPRASVCRIERGLYVLRYTESPSEPCPVARLRVVEGALEMIAAPGQKTSTLTHPGQAVVLLAQGSSVFEIAVSAAGRGGGTDASFSLDLLDEGVVEGREVDMSSSQASSAGHPSGRPALGSVVLDIVAHVSRRGDVRVAAGEWVAGPTDVLPIEGLSIDTLRHDLCIDVRVQTVGSRGQWSRWHQNGQFAGSRQRADAITAIGLSLHGDRSDGFVIAAEAMQLGASIRKSEGREVEFFGHDPIVGFRLDLKRDSQPAVSQVEQMSVPLKIFRARR